MRGTTVSHYEIVDEIGAGGMGVVYRARDRRLGRTVALKALPADKMRDPERRRRFLREARTASSLNHAGIIGIYDVLSEEGVDYIVMEYVQGVPLQDWIPPGGLAPAKALGYGTQIAEAVAAAHAVGVVHRDLKPGNVMVTPDERVKVLDFGLAKWDTWAESAADGAIPALTVEGTLLGTLEYMAPEQALGKTVDARADIFSLGVMLYEMLSGRRPFTGRNPVHLMEQIVKTEPAPLRSLRRDLPAAVDAMVGKAMAKDPDDRFAAMGQFATAMRECAADLGPLAGAAPPASRGSAEPAPPPRPTAATVLAPPAPTEEPGRSVGHLAALAGLALLLVLLLAVPGSRRWVAGRLAAPRPAAEEGEARPPSVGVLSLVNRTGDDELDSQGQVLAQLIRDNLSQSRHLHVLSLDTLLPLLERHGGELGAGAAAEAGIDYLLKGEILETAGGLTVAARLTDTRAGSELAPERLDAVGKDELIAGADRIAAAVRRGLSVPPDEGVDVFATDFASGNPAAYGLYVEGLTAFADFRYEEAERWFVETLARAPDFAMARYRLALAYAVGSETEKAAAEIGRALADARDLPARERRYIEATEAYIGRRYPQAAEAFRGLIETDPYETEARHFLALVLHEMGDYGGQLEQARILIRQNRANPTAWSQLGTAHLALGDYNSAVLAFQEHLKLDPDSANAHVNLGDAYRALGELELASEQYRQSLAANPSFHFATLRLARVDFLRGQRGSAVEVLQSLVADDGLPSRHRIDAGFDLASILRSEGRFRAASAVLAELEQPIATERVREASALSIRGTCWMELGDLRRARRLIDRAIEESPGVPTRYLFARALLELDEGRLEAVRDTAAAIEEHKLPPEDPDRTEEKAAAYLEARVLLAEGDAAGAIDAAARALALGGYEYALYRLPLARAYLAAGRHVEALAAAKQAAGERDVTEPRLDLELDRERARLLEAEVQLALGRREAAAREAREFLARWSNSDDGLAEVELARRLAS